MCVPHPILLLPPPPFISAHTSGPSQGSCDANYLLKALLGGINRSIDKQN